MPKTLIAANPTFQKAPGEGINLFVSEMFSETIQGEGINIGVPAVFLRLQDCTLNCSWCCVKGTKILMSDYSYKNIEDIKIGDVVKTYTKKGLEDTKVLNCLTRKKIQTVKIKTDDNCELHCSFDHRLVSYVNHLDTKKIRRKLIKAEDSLNSFVKTIPNFLFDKDESNDYKLGYVKGVLFGDGSCNDILRLKLECCDIEMIDTCLKYVKDLFDYEKHFVLKTSFQKNRKPYYRCVFTKKYINEKLIEEPSYKEMKGFIAGFFDAEGTVTKQGISLCQKDPEILYSIEKYLNKLDFKIKYNQGSGVFILRLLGGYRSTVKFITYFNPKIKRKVEKIFQLRKIDGGGNIINIENFGIEDVYTLTTDKGYYIANGFLSKNCDSKSVWRYGNPFSIDEILKIWEENSVIDNFEKGCHLVLTGGSPLYQQHSLFQLIKEFGRRYDFYPYIEIENECVLKPTEELASLINCWNNSPKLESSGNSKRAAYKPEIIKKVASFDNSFFKFVVIDELDWNEIERDYLMPGLIDRSQIILMPCGETQEELKSTRELTVNIAVREGVRFSDRVHITIWDKKTGV